MGFEEGGIRVEVVAVSQFERRWGVVGARDGDLSDTGLRLVEPGTEGGGEVSRHGWEVA